MSAEGLAEPHPASTELNRYDSFEMRMETVSMRNSKDVQLIISVQAVGF